MINTVYDHVAEGIAKPRTRKTVDDFELAATWLEAYEADSERDMDLIISLATMAQWLRNEAARRA